MPQDTSHKDRATPAKGTIQSLDRASQILDAVAAKGAAGASLTEMGDATGLHSSTVFHLVKTLEHLGYVARLGEGKAYFIGPRLFSLAACAPQLQTLAGIGRPVLDALSAETGEASHLAVLSGAGVLMVAQAPARGMLQISRNTGQPRPIHATAIGKVLLAASDPPSRKRLIAEATLDRFTPQTITDAGLLETEIETVAQQGFAEDRAEFDTDIRCVAVAVPAFSDRLTVAMGISGPVWRMDDAAVSRHLPALRRHAGQLGLRLGASPAPTIDDNEARTDNDTSL